MKQLGFKNVRKYEDDNIEIDVIAEFGELEGTSKAVGKGKYSQLITHYGEAIKIHELQHIDKCILFGNGYRTTDL